MRRQDRKSIAGLVCTTILFALGAMGCNLSGEAVTGTMGMVHSQQEFSAGEERAAVEVSSISQDKYVYELLDEETKRVYDQMLECILEQQESIVMLTKDTTVMEQAYNALNADYGGLFWNSGYVYTRHTRNDEIQSIDFQPEYTMSYEERTELQKEIDQQVELFLGGISDTDSDYAKVKYVFENLIDQVDYETGVENDQNIISVFLNKKTVCQGYACATQYLLDQLNIQGAIITGTAGGESHAWNLVKMDGEYYYVDTTWGNSAYLNSDSQETKYVNYNYLGMTTLELNQTHQESVDFELPECSSMKDNYYVQEKRYVENWDPDRIGGLCSSTWQAGGKSIALKFATQELYDQTRQYFITDRHIQDYCSEVGTFYYLEDTTHLVLTIYL